MEGAGVGVFESDGDGEGKKSLKFLSLSTKSFSESSSRIHEDGSSVSPLCFGAVSTVLIAACFVSPTFVACAIIGSMAPVKDVAKDMIIWDVSTVPPSLLFDFIALSTSDNICRA